MQSEPPWAHGVGVSLRGGGRERGGGGRPSAAVTPTPGEPWGGGRVPQAWPPAAAASPEPPGWGRPPSGYSRASLRGETGLGRWGEVLRQRPGRGVGPGWGELTVLPTHAPGRAAWSLQPNQPGLGAVGTPQRHPTPLPTARPVLKTLMPPGRRGATRRPSPGPTWKRLVAWTPFVRLRKSPATSQVPTG